MKRATDLFFAEYDTQYIAKIVFKIAQKRFFAHQKIGPPNFAEMVLWQLSPARFSYSLLNSIPILQMWIGQPTHIIQFS